MRAGSLDLDRIHFKLKTLDRVGLASDARDEDVASTSNSRITTNKFTHANMSLPKTLVSAGNTIPFRLITKGRGGLLHFKRASPTLLPRNDPSYTRQVGIYGATDSTGVYFALDQNTCFAAHIQSHVYDRNTSAIRHKISKLEGEDLQQQILNRLQLTLGLVNPNNSKSFTRKYYAKRSLLMVNPNMHHPDGSEQVGVYVAKAVHSYLGLNEWDYPVDMKHSGFVLPHLQRPYMVSLAAAQKTDGGKPTELEVFSEIEEDGRLIEDWTFVVNAREDWVE